jgi:hypothetical protein
MKNIINYLRFFAGRFTGATANDELTFYVIELVMKVVKTSQLDWSAGQPKSVVNAMALHLLRILDVLTEFGNRVEYNVADFEPETLTTKGKAYEYLLANRFIEALARFPMVVGGKQIAALENLFDEFFSLLERNKEAADVLWKLDENTGVLSEVADAILLDDFYYLADRDV